MTVKQSIGTWGAPQELQLRVCVYQAHTLPLTPHLPPFLHSQAWRSREQTCIDNCPRVSKFPCTNIFLPYLLNAWILAALSLSLTPRFLKLLSEDSRNRPMAAAPFHLPKPHLTSKSLLLTPSSSPPFFVRSVPRALLSPQMSGRATSPTFEHVNSFPAHRRT